MPLHGLSSITVGVPSVADTREYYAEFGLAPEPGGWLSTRDGGRQLRLVPAAFGRLVEVVSSQAGGSVSWRNAFHGAGAVCHR